MASTRITTVPGAAGTIPTREPIYSTGPDGKVLFEKTYEVDKQGGDPAAIPARQEPAADPNARTGHKEFKYERDFGAEWGLNREVSPERAEQLRQQYGVNVSGSLKGPAIKVEGKLDYTASLINGIDIDANLVIDARLIEAKGKIERTFTKEIRGEKVDIKVELEGEAGVKLSAEANLKIHLGTLGRFELQADGRAFAGAHGALRGKISMAVNDTEVAAGKLTLDAGIGVRASGSLNVTAGIPKLSDVLGAKFEGTWKDWRAKGAFPVNVTTKVDFDMAGVVDPTAAKGAALAMLFAGPYGPIAGTQGLRPSEVLTMREQNIPKPQ